MRQSAGGVRGRRSSQPHPLSAYTATSMLAPSVPPTAHTLPIPYSPALVHTQFIIGRVGHNSWMHRISHIPPPIHLPIHMQWHRQRHKSNFPTFDAQSVHPKGAINSPYHGLQKETYSKSNIHCKFSKWFRSHSHFFI